MKTYLDINHMCKQMNKEKCLVLFRGTRYMYRFPIEKIVYIQTIPNEDWCSVVMAEPLKHLGNPIDIPMRLSQIVAELQLQIDGYYNLVRCGRSTLINISYIRQIDSFQSTIHLSDGINFFMLNVSREACKEMMILMKNIFEA